MYIQGGSYYYTIRWVGKGRKKKKKNPPVRVDMPPLVYLVAAGRHFSHRHRASLTLQLPHTYTHQKSRYIVTLGERKKNRWNIRRKVARQKQNYHTQNAGGCSSILFRTLFFKSSLSLSLSILLRYFFVTNSFFFFFFQKEVQRENISLSF